MYNPPSLPPSNHSTPRFSGAHNHHYLLDFLQSVAEHYYQDGRAGDFIMHLLQLNVPKLFAVEVGGDKDEAVCRKFSSFLKNYILRCCLQHTLLNNMHRILVRKPSNHVLCLRMSLSPPLLPGCNLGPLEWFSAAGSS